MTGLRTKLVGILLIASLIPLAGVQAIKASRDFLLQGQENAQLLSAQGLAAVFHNRLDLFDYSANTRNDEHILYLREQPNRVRLDGDKEDWDPLWPRRDTFQGRTIAFDMLMAYREHSIYGIVDVKDSSPVFRHPAWLRLDRSDHLRLRYRNPDGTTQRIALVFEGEGQASAYQMDEHWRYASKGQPEYALRSWVKYTPQGYRVEFSLPRSWLGPQIQMGITVANVKNASTRRIVELVSSFPEQGLNSAKHNRFISRSAETEAILNQLEPDGRLWILDRGLHVQASRGELQNSRPGAAGTWQALGQAIINRSLATLLGQGSLAQADHDPTSTFQRQGPHLQRALLGQGGVYRRTTADGKGEIIAAAWPIRADEEILGVALVEQTTNEVLALQRSSVERLLSGSLLASLVVSLLVIALASRLTFRIRRLGRAAAAAVDQHGRMRDGEISCESNHGDEIGDLARDFNRMLARLAEHQQFISQIPRALRHEINNPLNTISTSLQRLKKEPDKNHIERAQHALDRIRLLVDRLGEAASLEQALAEEDMETIDLAALLEQYRDNRSLVQPDIKLQLAAPKGSVWVNASGFHLEQLLDKLVDNAIDFHYPETPIQISLLAEAGQLELSVSNQGPLLNDEGGQLFQLMHSVRDTGCGDHFGLGLYVAKVICEFHGGNIEGTNHAQGACFKVTLPLASSPL